VVRLPMWLLIKHEAIFGCVTVCFKLFAVAQRWFRWSLKGKSL